MSLGQASDNVEGSSVRCVDVTDQHLTQINMSSLHVMLKFVHEAQRISATE